MRFIKVKAPYLDRSKPRPVTAFQRKGRQSQSWLRMPEGWRIVAAHVSDIVE